MTTQSKTELLVLKATGLVPAAWLRAVGRQLLVWVVNGSPKHPAVLEVSDFTLKASVRSSGIQISNQKVFLSPCHRSN